MDAGRLNHRVTFRRKTAIDDGYGNTVGAFADLMTVWANVRETTGKERVAAGSVENNRTATMRIRASTESRGITEADQVVARGETWNIRGIANVGDNSGMLDLLIEAGVAQ